MNNKKNEKMFIILGIVIILIIFTLVLTNIKSNKYLIINETLILQKNGNHWTQIEEINDDILKSKYTITDGKSILENVSLSYASNKWYYMNKDYSNIKITPRVAYTNIDKVDLATYTIENCSQSDYNYFEEILADKKIKNTNIFVTNGRKVNYDIDDDGAIETIYTSTNRSFEAIDDDILSVVFIVKDGNVYQNVEMSDKPYRITEILDLNNDGKYEFIINKGDIDVSSFDSCYQIYKVKNNKLKLYQDCQ